MEARGKGCLEGWGGQGERGACGGKATRQEAQVNAYHSNESILPKTIHTIRMNSYLDPDHQMKTSHSNALRACSTWMMCIRAIQT